MEVAEPWLDCLLQEFYNQVNQPRKQNTEEMEHPISVIISPFLSSERRGEVRGSSRHALHGPR